MTFAALTAIAEAEVKKIHAKLPPDLAALAARVAVHFATVPDAALLADGFEPDLLGLFDGTAYAGELNTDMPSPPQIFLYLENLHDYADGDPAAFRAEARLTYLHELGHYLGWDEDDLAARGLD
ncbi:MAG: metallopeptidase family protein [Verrucomicrobiales bacterium]|jgi:predicted Zn-dependent protease with MMP-like domain|nr:metallopeptidase family protein [Verrucomicrobiales bacterium]